MSLIARPASQTMRHFSHKTAQPPPESLLGKVLTTAAITTGVCAPFYLPYKVTMEEKKLGNPHKER
jgi:hypothetical protein